MSAIAHPVEGLYAQGSNPIMAAYTPNNPAMLDAWSDCLFGALLCGTLLGSAGMALHHKLCHTLGGTWNLPHAETSFVARLGKFFRMIGRVKTKPEHLQMNIRFRESS